MDDYDARLRRSADWPIARGAPLLRLRRAAVSKPVRRTVVGFVVFFVLWYLATAVFQLPRFNFIPNPLYLFEQWTSREQYGISLFTPDYYEHIVTSVLRVYVAFFLSIALGAPLGILIG
ncbi:hypothetical protein [Chenggangzhangella methanolivorans]|uniref:ABC transporter permease n=1 Tax=Chenggangzhangella methanolivorans TaxID=1437009 RepID=A0A9E6RDJ9_9HYPH|nr:hypothetical protein [Chenggangzhangella methanolivorans]QZN99120.1 hypothetical protein K6K41_20070 [Chenggangzhangella methanolivorans]